MFTGIIRYQGTITGLERRSGDVRLAVTVPAPARTVLAPGDSIAVNGVCLTVATLATDGFGADVSNETLGLTTLGDLTPGTAVNLEPALAIGERLGGHLVSGHVDGIGTVRSINRDARSLRIAIGVPGPLSRYLARKGSVCVDGVSLTINSVSGNDFDVNIIPHTADETTIGGYATGSRVNIEVDLLARYIERLLGDGQDGITKDFLKAHGYA